MFGINNSELVARVYTESHGFFEGVKPFGVIKVDHMATVHNSFTFFDKQVTAIPFPRLIAISFMMPLGAFVQPNQQFHWNKDEGTTHINVFYSASHGRVTLSDVF
jgi:hypothetical protein